MSRPLRALTFAAASLILLFAPQCQQETFNLLPQTETGGASNASGGVAGQGGFNRGGNEFGGTFSRGGSGFAGAPGNVAGHPPFTTGGAGFTSAGGALNSGAGGRVSPGFGGAGGGGGEPMKFPKPGCDVYCPGPNCIQCNDATPCPAPLVCNSFCGECVECERTENCSRDEVDHSSQVCDSNTKACTQLCGQTNACADPSRPICDTRGLCVECVWDADCEPPDRYCDFRFNRCTECFGDSDCFGRGGECSIAKGKGTCVCTDSSQCDGSAAGAECLSGHCGCVGPEDCDARSTCINGFCVRPSSGP